MARQKPATRKQSRSKRDTQQKVDPVENQDDHGKEIASYEQELASLLQERIKPGLNRGAIPLLARSIAKDIAHRDPSRGESEDIEVEDEISDEADDEITNEADDDEITDEADDDDVDDEADDEITDEADDEVSDEADDEVSDEADDEVGDEAEDEPRDAVEPPPDFRADMQDFQAELGEEGIVRFSVQGDDAWLTAEKDDGSQRVEAPDASALAEAVELLNESGGRSP